MVSLSPVPTYAMVTEAIVAHVQKYPQYASWSIRTVRGVMVKTFRKNFQTISRAGDTVLYFRNANANAIVFCINRETGDPEWITVPNHWVVGKA